MNPRVVSPLHSRHAEDKAVTLPTLPSVDERWSFPIIGSLAPLLLSVAVWLITQSVMALVFAGLGPVMAVGSYCDARWKSRRKHRRERARFSTELHQCLNIVELLHSRERSRFDALVPSASQIVAGRVHFSTQWRSAPRRELVLSLGRGAQPSEIDPQGNRPPPSVDTPEEFALAELLSTLGSVDDAPIALRLELDSSTRGIGVCGPEPLASAYARSLVIQIVRTLSPGQYGISSNSESISNRGAWAWLAELPHPVLRPHRRASVAGRVDIRIEPIVATTTEQPIVISIARYREHLPGELDALVSLDTRREPSGARSPIAHHRILHHRGLASEVAISIEVVSIEQATHWATKLAVLAEREGFVTRREGALPERVALHEVLTRTARSGKLGDDSVPPLTSLACVFAVGIDGDESIDLVLDGPHAVVGGTTGSGKSELLISWVAAIAAGYSAAEVNFLLVDYKGGASFGDLVSLPHCVGVITDLDAVTSARAFESLSAELRYRESALATTLSKSIVENPAVHGLARLVIVVDEFAAMAAEHPELHALFSDIAARGRSLGVHLILCTQRPGGVIRDAVLANSALRISLRVNNRADSVAVVGDDTAAQLPARILGRAILARAGEPSQLLQCALTQQGDIEKFARPVPVPLSAANDDALWLPRRPWLDPLGERISLESLQAEAEPEPEADVVAGGEVRIVFGVSDYPEHQQQPLATYQPRLHGHLLIVGDSFSGKSATLETLAQSAGMLPFLEAIRVAPGVEALWDTVTRELERVRADRAVGSRLVLVDDVDAIMPRLGFDHERELSDRLCQLLREGPARGVHCVIATRGVGGALGAVASMMGARLVLAHASRQEFILAGGDAKFFRPRLLPGRAQWQEHSTQIALPGHVDHLPGAERCVDTPDQVFRAIDFAPEGSFAVITASPATTTARLNSQFVALGSDHEILDVGAAQHAGDTNLTVTVGARPRAVIGTPEKWQSFWGALETVSTQWPVVIEGCSVSEYRSVTRSKSLPPPLENSKEYGWLLRPGLPVVRTRLTAVAADV